MVFPPSSPWITPWASFHHEEHHSLSTHLASWSLEHSSSLLALLAKLIFKTFALDIEEVKRFMFLYFYFMGVSPAMCSTCTQRQKGPEGPGSCGARATVVGALCRHKGSNPGPLYGQLVNHWVISPASLALFSGKPSYLMAVKAEVGQSNQKSLVSFKVYLYF